MTANQCDGCARGLPIKADGFHYDGDFPWGACIADNPERCIENGDDMPCIAKREAGTPRTDAVAFWREIMSEENYLECAFDDTQHDLALIRAGLEAGAKVCQGCVEASKITNLQDAENAANWCKETIRALSPESILEEWKGTK